MSSQFIFIINIICLLLFSACDFHSSERENGKQDDLKKPTSVEQISNFQKGGKTLQERFTLPDGYTRISSEQSLFAQYLRTLPLKPKGSNVLYYNGTIKPNNNIYMAVVDKSIGRKDLHQCADAIMRLRAEYLWQNKKFEQIHFNLTNGFKVDYSNWMSGKRVKVEGNKTEWISRKPASNTYDDFWSYIEFIFMYAGTASLSKELHKVEWHDIRIGDILIQGGHPGHAVLVVDMAENKNTKEKIFMLAQSYMPAQETHILCNPKDINSPWYSLNGAETIVTPEWTFKRDDLKRFHDYEL